MADVFGSIGSALGLTGDGKLEKLAIYGYDTKDRDEKNSPASKTGATIFEAMINPDEITVSYSTLYDHNMPIGKETTPGTFLASTPMELQLKFFIDGTLPRSQDDQ